MNEQEDEYLDIAGIQHFTFCKRQWALIHIEQEWKDNVLTVEGNIIHEKAHDKTSREKRGNILIVRNLEIKSTSLKAHGFCDIVEFHVDKDGVALEGLEQLWKPIPIEYKRGKSKASDADRLQLCTQAICLEEMFDCRIDKAYLFYHEINHREEVALDEILRNKVSSSFLEMSKYYDRRYTPKVKTSKKCNSCSLIDICLPQLNVSVSVIKYVSQRIDEINEYEKA